MATKFRSLPPARICAQTEVARRFLASAYDSVEGVLVSFDTVREARKTKGDIRGRLPQQEEDLLRAAISFACAGLDSTLKRAIRDALPALLEQNKQAHDRFERFVASYISPSEVADPKRIARYLALSNPREALIDAYIFELTGASLQSAEEVDKAAGALGIDDSDLRKRIATLRDAFTARNQILHELDLQRVQKQGDRSRRTRNLGESLKIAHEVLEVAQLILNAVAEMLR